MAYPAELVLGECAELLLELTTLKRRALKAQAKVVDAQ